MKCTIFDFGKFKVMLMGDEKGTEMYMQINSSNWSFCVGNNEPFDEWDDEEHIKALAIDYFEIVKKEEDGASAMKLTKKERKALMYAIMDTLDEIDDNKLVEKGEFSERQRNALESGMEKLRVIFNVLYN